MIDAEREQALTLAKGLAASPANIDRIARSVGPEVARWAFSQWELRSRAKHKFARADEMLFVREALEQSTAETLASYHASLFPEGQFVADLTAGIGGDLLALARRGPAIGFELDSDRAEAARHNLSIHKLNAEVREEDSLSVEWNWEFALADPARRVQGRRTLDPTEFSPNPVELASRFAHLRLGILKLSPLLPDSFLTTLGPSLKFVSCQDECREALVGAGSQAREERLAIHIESGDSLPAGLDAPYTETVGEFFFDADPAAVRAHSLGTLANRHGLCGLGDSRGYLTGSDLQASPWLRPYRVLYSDKADIAKTRKQLQQLGAATPEIKQRHAEQNGDQIRKALRGDGTRRLSVAIWPVGRSLRHTILEPLS